VFVIEPHAEADPVRDLLAAHGKFRQRLARLLGPPEPGSKRLNLREFARACRYRIAGSPLN